MNKGGGNEKFDLGKGNTIARIKKGSSHFEIIVNMNDALEFKSGKSDYLVVEGDCIFTDVKKGNRASVSELENAFGTSSVDDIGKEIVKNGDVLVDSEHRSAEQEQKIKRVIDFLATNAIDPQTRQPITSERIKNAMSDAHVNLKNVPFEQQVQDTLAAIQKVMPIKIETRKIKITIPAMQTGKAYGVISTYKEKENWLSDGSLEATVNVPAGILIDFYDKLNSVTHGSALTEELDE